ncbi:MAG: hypothetical protein RIQ89_1942 [Bacteroidota bacterium]|jgi:hypothetical protein
MINGKQINDGTITEAKIAALPPTPSSANAPASKTYVDTQIQQSVNNQDWKNSVRAASSTNINLSSPGATIGGVTMNNGDRFLAYGQTTASQNWIYVYNGAAAAATRATDADGNTEVTPQAAVSVEEGTDGNKSFRITNTGAIIVGTTNITVSAFVTFSGANPSTANKFMVASVTVTDNDLACSTTMAATPSSGSYVKVVVNGDEPEIGNAVKTKDCYFSGDSGATARAYNAVVSGDRLYWNGSIAGYQLAATDKISFEYNV